MTVSPTLESTNRNEGETEKDADPISIPHDQVDPIRQELALIWTLRFLGFVDVLALLAVVMPLRWMSSINEWCGMGPLPEVPLIGYLTRTTSALYAFHGGIILFLSINVRQYLPLIRFMSLLSVLHGMILLYVDMSEHMPWFWIMLEAPSFILIGLWTWWLAKVAGAKYEARSPVR